MPDGTGQMKKRPGWHLRPFSETLKRRCGAKAKEQGKAEYQWVTEILCKELGISVESLVLLDSQLESRDKNGRDGTSITPPRDSGEASTEKLRGKEQTKAQPKKPKRDLQRGPLMVKASVRDRTRRTKSQETPQMQPQSKPVGN